MKDPLAYSAFHRFVRRLARVVVWVTGPWKTYGLENLPARGPFVFCANHMSYWDSPFAFAALPPVRLHVLAAKKYRRHLLFGPLLAMMPVIWIEQRGADRAALAAADEVLRKGLALAMAPEGTRSKTDALIEPRPGVAYLTTAGEIPIVPCALTGTELVKRNFPWRRTPMTLTLGKPFRLAPIEGGNRMQQLQDRTDVIMAHIAYMLPEKYHGVYAGHPYLEQLRRGEGPLPGELPYEGAGHALSGANGSEEQAAGSGQ